MFSIAKKNYDFFFNSNLVGTRFSRSDPVAPPQGPGSTVSAPGRGWCDRPESAHLPLSGAALKRSRHI